MPNILDRLPNLIANTVGKLVMKPAVLTKAGPGTGPAYDPTEGAPGNHPCLAIAVEFSDYARAGGYVAAYDKKVLIAAATLKGVVPSDGDYITLEGKTYTISSEGGAAPAVKSDPANATYECRARA